MNSMLKSPHDREKFFIRLYKLSFPDVARFIRKRGGSMDDARDLFQDALMIYYEKAVQDNFSPKKNERAYIMGTVRYLWFRKYKDHQTYLPLPEHEQLLVFDEAENTIPAASGLLSFLENAGRKCMEMLKAFYYDRLSIEELSSTFGYSSTRSATVQKYKCLEKVRDKVKEKSLHYEDFLE